MPAIDSLLVALVTSTDPEAAAQENISEDLSQNAGGFEQAMTDALTPEANAPTEELPRKAAPKLAMPVKSPAMPTGKTASGAAGLVEASEETSSGKSDQAVGDNSSSSEIKTPIRAAADGANDPVISTPIFIIPPQPALPWPGAPVAAEKNFAAATKPDASANGNSRSAQITMSPQPLTQNGGVVSTKSGDANFSGATTKLAEGLNDQSQTVAPSALEVLTQTADSSEAELSQPPSSPEFISQKRFGKNLSSDAPALPSGAAQPAPAGQPIRNLAAPIVTVSASDAEALVNPEISDNEMISVKMATPSSAEKNNTTAKISFRSGIISETTNAKTETAKNSTVVLTAAGKETVLQMEPTFPSNAGNADVDLASRRISAVSPQLEQPVAIVTVPGRQISPGRGEFFAPSREIQTDRKQTGGVTENLATQATSDIAAKAPTIFSPRQLVAQTFQNPSTLQPEIVGAEVASPDKLAGIEISANSGTRVASIPAEMKNSEKVEVLAGFTGQKLPDAGPVRLAPGFITRGTSDLPPRLSEHTTTKVSNDFVPSLASFASEIPPIISDGASALTLPSLAEARALTVERTHELVSLHALRFAETRTDSLSIVLKPDAGTELSLQLRQRDGMVEAQATLASGDYQLLNQNWPELQSRLEAHGVKLSSLTGDTTGFNANAGNQFSRQRSPERDAETENALAFAEFSVATGGASARSAGVTGREWWA